MVFFQCFAEKAPDHLLQRFLFILQQHIGHQLRLERQANRLLHGNNSVRLDLHVAPDTLDIQHPKRVLVRRGQFLE